MTTDKVIKLISADGVAVETTMKQALMSMTIKDMMETLGDSQTCDEIPVAAVDAKSLKLVVKWMEHWQDEKQPTSEEIKDKTAEQIDAWDEEYFSGMRLTDLYSLITAANYLNIPGLLWLSTREVAYKIKGKTAEEIRETFNIPNDWTAAELEMVQKENQWCEEK